MLPGVGPGPRTCSTRFRSGAYSVNRGEQGRSWPGPTSLGPLARTRTPGPVLARPNAPLGRGGEPRCCSVRDLREATSSRPAAVRTPLCPVRDLREATTTTPAPRTASPPGPGPTLR